VRIQTQISINDPEYKENYSKQLALCDELDELIREIKLGGGEKSILREKKKGKLTARQRIDFLVDDGSEFLELSALAAYEVYEDRVPAAGVITGIGKIAGRLCMIVANDQTVKGGTYYPLTVKKHLRAQRIAEKNYLPCIYLVDSGGAFLPMQAEVFPDEQHFGRIFYNQARMSSKGISQISSVHGFCTAGGAYIPAMSDQSVIVKKTGTIFLGGPPLVKAATGEEISPEQLGGAHVHTSISGVCDHMAQNDKHALMILKDIMNFVSSSKEPVCEIKEAKEPLYDTQELLGIMPHNLFKAIDVREILARILDASYLCEFKQNYGTTLVTGFAHICGMPVGVIASNGILFSESALKGTHFVELCCQQNIPLIFFQNITGFMVGKKYEHEGIAKHGAKLVNAVANASVAKITMVLGGSYGAGNYGMCGRAFDPDFLFMWPGARISVMGGQQAAKVLVTVKEDQAKRLKGSFSKEQKKDLEDKILAKYAKEAHAFYASARLWDDGVIDPRQTRTVLAKALAASLYKPKQATKFGTFRM
jgi:acetyl-CoA carboxylase carboxyltransferase component